MKIWSDLHSDMENRSNYNGQPKGRCKTWLYAGIPGNPAVLVRVRTLSKGDGMSSDNPTGADNQQETVKPRQDPQRLHARPAPKVGAVKIQSDLHGDMQSQAEMPWPSQHKLRE